jgi:hypothetical protein
MTEMSMVPVQDLGELERRDGRAILTYTRRLRQPRRSGGLGKAARDGAGWHSCLDQLVQELGDDAVAAVPADRWRELRDPYIKHFGPDASTIGPPEEWERAHGAGTDGSS